MKLDLNEALTYDDVVIVPQFSEHTTRAQSNTSWKLKNFTFQKPIIAANMDTICGPEMALQMAQLGGLGIIHRYLTVAQYKEISDSWHANNPEFPLAFAVGTLSNDKERIDFCMNGGCEIICIDIAHGDCQAMLDTIAYIRASWDGALIAGNTATFEGTKRLIDAGADMVKVGVANGCFAGDTRVLMADGSYKYLKDINLHDKVINKDGNPVDVIGVKYSGKQNVMKYRSNLSHTWSYATQDHEHFVGDYSSIKDIQQCSLVKKLALPTKNGESKLKWKSLKDSAKDVVMLMPNKIKFNIPESFELHEEQYMLSRRTFKGFKEPKVIKPSYDLGYIFGTFLGDGHARLTSTQREDGRRNTSGSTSWYFGLGEEGFAKKLQKAIKDVFDMNMTYGRAKDKNIILCQNRNNGLSRMLLEFGKKTDKQLPEKFVCSDKEYLKGLLDGLIDSDGCIKDTGSPQLSNTSSKLIEQYSLFHYLVNGYYPSMGLTKPSAGGLKNCNIENCHESYQATSVGHPDNYIVDNFQIARVYTGITEATEEIDTYDIEVDCPTHSFIANNVIVHNSVCSTRVKTGSGMSQLTAVIECAEAGPIIADGGIKIPADACKALAGGATAIMLGGMLAGTDKVPGWLNPLDCEGVEIKFSGMASLASKTKAGLRGINAEGVERSVACKPAGSTAHIVEDITEGVRSAMSYTGAFTLEEFTEKAVLRKISIAGQAEGPPHFKDK